MRIFARNRIINDPVFVLSYMRSGSNFLSNVICRSNGQRFTSIYAPEVTPMQHAQPYLILKSHAPSYIHLLSEIGAFVPCLERLPHRMVVLMRDPRDVFISLHEWYESRYGLPIEQEGFLHNMDFCYSAPGLGRMSPLETFRCFANNWWEFSEKTSVKSVFRLKYEDLLLDKKKYFTEASDFLGLKKPIREDLFEKRVQLGGGGNRDRGVSGGYKLNREKYGVIIDSVEDELGDILKRFAYF